jgi:hypothetical protein
MLKKVFEIYKRLLSIHILTKTTDENGFHKDTEDAYEKSFDIFHSISELRQDLEMDTPEEVESVAQEAYDLVEELKGLLEKEVKSNKDIAMDELLR